MAVGYTGGVSGGGSTPQSADADIPLTGEPEGKNKEDRINKKGAPPRVSPIVGTLVRALLVAQRGPRQSPASAGLVGKGGVPQGDFLRAKGSERSFSPKRRKRSSRTFRRRGDARRAGGSLSTPIFLKFYQLFIHLFPFPVQCYKISVPGLCGLAKASGIR